MFISTSLLSQNLSKFEATTKACGMNLNIPEGFVECKTIANKDLDYDYALKYPDKDFELRLAVRPIKLKVYSSDSLKNAMESKIASRNASYESDLKSIIYDITGGVQYEIKAFEKNAVKDEFNADWGAILLVEMKSDFGKGYKYCMIVALHKDNAADAYYLYLAKNKDNYPENMRPLFHTLRFDD